MAQRGTRYLVEIFIESVISPGTWLPERGDLYVVVGLFDQRRQTHPLPPSFPVWFNSTLKFDKIFKAESGHDHLKNSRIHIQLMQSMLGYKDGRVLAAYESNVKEFLYPFSSHSQSYSTHDRHVTLEKDLSFPGITPRLEFSTRVKVEVVDMSGNRGYERVGQHYGGSQSNLERGFQSPFVSKSPGRRIRRYIAPYSTENSQRTDWHSHGNGYGPLEYRIESHPHQRARSASPNDSRRSFAELYLDDEPKPYIDRSNGYNTVLGDSRNMYYENNSLSGNSYDDIHDYTSRRKRQPLHRARSLTKLSRAECDCDAARVTPKFQYGGYGRPTISSLRKSQSFIPPPSLEQHLDELYITDDGYRVTGIGDRDSHTPFHLERVGSAYEGSTFGPTKHRMWTNGRVKNREGKDSKFDFYDYLSERTKEPEDYDPVNSYIANSVYKKNFRKRHTFSAVKVNDPDKDTYYERDGSYSRRAISSRPYEWKAVDQHYDCHRTPGTIEYMDGNDDWGGRNRRYHDSLAKQQLSYKW